MAGARRERAAAMIMAGLVLGACTATPAAEDPAPSAGGYDPNIQPTASTWIYQP